MTTQLSGEELELIVAALSMMQESDDENGHADLARRSRDPIERLQTEFGA